MLLFISGDHPGKTGHRPTCCNRVAGSPFCRSGFSRACPTSPGTTSSSTVRPAAALNSDWRRSPAERPEFFLMTIQTAVTCSSASKARRLMRACKGRDISIHGGFPLLSFQTAYQVLRRPACNVLVNSFKLEIADVHPCDPAGRKYTVGTCGFPGRSSRNVVGLPSAILSCFAVIGAALCRGRIIPGSLLENNRQRQQSSEQLAASSHPPAMGRASSPLPSVDLRLSIQRQ